MVWRRCAGRVPGRGAERIRPKGHKGSHKVGPEVGRQLIHRLARGGSASTDNHGQWLRSVTSITTGYRYRYVNGMMVGMKGRVLVVDDDTALSEMLGIVLRGEGFEPSFCADGDKALAAFRENKPDLVLLDLMLPGRDGIDVCRQIRAESGVPIVMLTAKSDTVDVVVGLESGADDYVIKPFKPKELVARVRARLRRAEEPTPEQAGDR